MNANEAIVWVEQNYPQYPPSQKYIIAQHVMRRAAALRQQQMVQGAQDSGGGSTAGGIAGAVLPTAAAYGIEHLLSSPGVADQALTQIPNITPDLITPSVDAVTFGGEAVSQVANNIPADSLGTFDQGGALNNTLGNFGQGALGAAGLALGSKGVYDAYNARNPLGGAISGAGAGAGGLALAGSLGLATGGLALPVIAGAALLGGGAGLAGRKKTQEAINDRWNYLQGQGIKNVNQLKQANHPDNDTGVWKDGKYAGQQWTFEKALDLAKEDPSHFAHVYGNYETFGKDYESLSLDQQKNLVSLLAHNNLYKGHKGDVHITDKNKAMEYYNQVKQGGQQPMQGYKPTPQQVGQMPVNNPLANAPGNRAYYQPAQPMDYQSWLASNKPTPSLTPQGQELRTVMNTFGNKNTLSQGDYMNYLGGFMPHRQQQQQQQVNNPLANQPSYVPYQQPQVPKPQPQQTNTQAPRWAQNLSPEERAKYL